MNYTNIRNLCKQYNINMFNENGKLFKYNNLRNKINDYENKKHNLSQKQKLYKSIEKYLDGCLSDVELDNAMYHYIGN